MEAAAAKAKELGAKRAMPLNVAGAYHSELMAPAGEKLRADLAEASFKAPSVPVYSNVTAETHGGDPEGIRSLLVQQVSGTVRWRESMAAMFAAGVERCYEFGPGGVLRGLVRRNDRSKKCQSVLTVEDVKQAAADLAARRAGRRIPPFHPGNDGDSRWLRPVRRGRRGTPAALRQCPNGRFSPGKRRGARACGDGCRTTVELDPGKGQI